MRCLVAMLILLLLANHVIAQLTADAGPDKAKCKEWDSIEIGGAIAAGGGIPPYRYHWYMHDSVYGGGSTYVSINEYSFLDQPDSAHPKVVYHNYQIRALLFLK